MYGGREDNAHTLQRALQEAMTKVGNLQSGQSDTGGCAILLDREQAEYIELLGSGNLQFAGTSPFSIELWIMPRDTVKLVTLVSKYNRGKWGQYMVRLQPGGNVFFHREVAPWGLKTSEALVPNVFHHIATTYDGVRSHIYVNGTLWASQKEGGQDNNPETPVLIGASLEKGNALDFFDGIVDEVRMWSVSRSQEEIRAGMHLTLTGSEDGLSGYWPFNECGGERARDQKGAHDAILHGGTWIHSPITFAGYRDAFGCVDTLCR
mmetsp:Transcript_26770/g.44890  ORF Transcript_26770/g.44890 Transcript_26770/m.44890 type:complete len:264 (+) Transcript_26770:2-793(+)